ncbi:PAS domain-containing protein [Geomonas sp. Red32]|uniref:CheR family methyltransferase n=1 Tax=Geomonas sp. Red32 TaxID=2912856 RepID=UPI00202CAF1F|nr:CheR family methyltransferase [Geomonas sp. Red32]MCM0084408.1 PAS domain-containing protein [Geomonas sp. Red32]
MTPSDLDDLDDAGGDIRLTPRLGMPASPPAPHELKAIFGLVQSATGHDFSSYKENTILRRLHRRMTVNDVEVVAQYIDLLRENPTEAEALSQDILIGVTSFFRDPAAFDAIREQVLPQLFLGREPGRPVRIWHACCGTGEEAYSTAILVREFLAEHRLSANVQIFATDIDAAAIDQARSGSYREQFCRGISDERLSTYFTPTEDGWRVHKQLRDMIVFAHHSLIKDPPFSRIDLLVCRNFLIYVDPDLKKRLISLFHRVLVPNGYLFLGVAESVGADCDLFSAADKKWKIFSRRDIGTRLDVSIPLPNPLWFPPKERFRQPSPEDPTPATLAQKALLESYAPASVVVNEQYEVVHTFSRIAAFLELPIGQPTHDILKMARPELRPALRAAIYKALTEQTEVVFNNLPVEESADMALVNVVVKPLDSLPGHGKLLLVVFEPVRYGGAAAAPASLPVPSEGEERWAMLVRQLEEQLRITHEQLQATSEQLDSSNEEFLSTSEELMSMNEEFHSANEELQSANEELETSKEELQSLNEELENVNDELQLKVEELNRTTSQMENLLASSEIATLFLDRNLNLKGFTPAAASLFNLIPSDDGRPLRHFAGRINWPAFSLDAERVLAGETVAEQELTSLEGERCYLTRLFPFRTQDGGVDGLVVTLVDITERKAMEAALVASTAKLEAALASMSDAILITDNKGRFLDFNDAFATFHKFRNKEECSRKLAGYPDLLEAFLPNGEPAGIDHWAVSRALRGESCSNVEYGVRRKDTGKSWVASVSFAPIRDAAGSIVGSVMTARDVSEQKRDEVALRESEERYRSLVKSLQVAVFVNRQGKIAIANDATARLFGVPCVDGLIGRSPLDFVHPDFTALVESRVSTAMEGGCVPIMELKVVRSGGEERAVESTAVRFLDGKEPSILVIMHDVTERRDLEEQLRQSQKMEALGELAGGIAHDFNNILMVISGLSNILLMDSTLNGAQTERIQQIVSAAERAGQLTRSLLSFSRKQVMLPKLADLNEIVRHMQQLLVRIIGEDIVLEAVLADGPLPVMVDWGQIEQIMVNLTTNARDAMPKGGKLTLTTELLQFDQEILHAHGTGEAGSYAVLTFKDDGCGMDHHVRSRIFEPFFTTKNPGKGTGLGMAIVYGIIRQHKGFIDVQSHPGSGAAFQIFLPLVENAAEPVPEVTADQVSPHGSETILIAEDEEPVRKMVAEVLTRFGYRVIIAVDGDECVRKFDEHRDEVDLVLMDLIMPNKNGADAYQEIHALHPEVKVLYTSGYTSDFLENRGLQEEGIELLMKPVAPLVLLKKIREVLDR